MFNTPNDIAELQTINTSQKSSLQEHKILLIGGHLDSDDINKSCKDIIDRISSIATSQQEITIHCYVQIFESSTLENLAYIFSISDIYFLKERLKKAFQKTNDIMERITILGVEKLNIHIQPKYHFIDISRLFGCFLDKNEVDANALNFIAEHWFNL